MGGSALRNLALACMLGVHVLGLPARRSTTAPEQEPIMGIDFGSEWVKIGLITQGVHVSGNVHLHPCHMAFSHRPVVERCDEDALLSPLIASPQIMLGDS